ncbi:hypothetical protein CERSUDRAFT_111965 [Gelatoporia subvermispora B]|uniref:Uncharacterized protein n=1 Tax=Ceriporiopsis subvermispora (strain B) TaxID=914234 RepID=M2R510_CERS8|nr:hypothetical protein CERSUDRAFT_111965 [Gelatoporia subvermispora B]
MPANATFAYKMATISRRGSPSIESSRATAFPILHADSPANAAHSSRPQHAASTSQNTIRSSAGVVAAVFF